MQQDFRTIPLEVSLQKSKLFGSKSERKTGMDFFSKQKILKIFSGHLEWSFNITAKNISSKIPELFDGTKKAKKNLYEKN